MKEKTMNVKSVFGLILFFMAFVSVQAQDCEMFFPADEGTVLEMKDYDQKGKLTGSSIQTIKSKEELSDGIKLTVGQQTFDKKGEKVMDGSFDVRCENGVFYMDMRNMLNDEALEAYQGMEMEVDANDMAFPSNLSVGTTLPDADIVVKVNNAGVTLFTMTVNITNRKVEAKEDISTEAGTFSCYKISYDIETRMIMKIHAKATQWIAKDIGVVRSESYNKKGKLQGYTVLTQLK